MHPLINRLVAPAAVVALALVATPSFAKYTYRPDTGKCFDEKGRPGLNEWNVDKLFANPEVSPTESATYRRRDAECVKLVGFDGPAYMRSHNFTGYMTLIGWNFKGADLSGTKLNFYNLVDAQLQGAIFSSTVFGYTTLTGAIDGFTKLPDFCKPTATTLECRR